MISGRSSGILLPVSSLPSPYGIGCFSREALSFVDFLAEAGQKYWQILPLGPTGYGDSPYQSFSTFAGNPYFIDLSEFISLGWLKEEEVLAAQSADADPSDVDYGRLYETRPALLRLAYSRSGKVPGLDQFVEDNRWWLEDYALFTAIKESLGGVGLLSWPEPLRRRDPAALKEARERLADEISFVFFQQYFFEKQWLSVKTYANAKGIKIFGDMPIYVALDSSDTWAHPELFLLDEDGIPTAVAGCPPDAFAASGQLWGNPLYRWDYHSSTGYSWWLSRLRHCFDWLDVLRIDHFRGFDAYYSIPWQDPTAEFGHWEKGPGFDFIGTVKRELEGCSIVAEDLGYLTPSVMKLLADSGFPGMKVLQFAFDSREESDYLPHNYPRNCVVYTGTHDNETMRGWCQMVDRNDYACALRYLGYIPEEAPETAFIRAAMASVADTCVIPLQDYLGLGHEARINTPSTLGGNWRWRLVPGQLTEETAVRIRDFTGTYGRLRNKGE